MVTNEKLNNEGQQLGDKFGKDCENLTEMYLGQKAVVWMLTKFGMSFKIGFL